MRLYAHLWEQADGGVANAIELRRERARNDEGSLFSFVVLDLNDGDVAERLKAAVC
jgi:hypothetical protein